MLCPVVSSVTVEYVWTRFQLEHMFVAHIQH